MEALTILVGAVIVVLARDVHSQLMPGNIQKNFWITTTTATQQPKNSFTVVPPAQDRCQVEERARIRCGHSDVTPEQCQSIDCCYDGQRCYYGKAVTLQCTRDGQFVVVVARDATLPHIDVETVSLLESGHESCSPAAVTAAFTIFQFAVTRCGTRISEEDGYIVYENHMSSAYEVGIGPKGSITRDSHFELLFQCRYSGSAAQALVMEVNDVPAPLPVAAAGPLRVELRLGSGQCHGKGCVAEVAAYSSYYTQSDYPITKVLRDPVYVEVRLLERTDPNVVLTLQHCWATAGPNPSSQPQWDLLLNGCPYSEDNYMTKVVPVDANSGLSYPTHYKRFIVKMFTFVDQASYSPHQDTVFIHCSTAVCYPSSVDSCQPQCHRQRRSAVSSRQKALVSSKQLILTSDLPFRSSQREGASTRISASKFNA
ncbi:unnamed protein product [Knipowitschia caucasica]